MPNKTISAKISVMHTFDGNLVVDGLRLDDLHGELEQELPDGESSDWLFAGRVTLTRSDREHLQLGRRYRLELHDGRAGEVIISHLRAVDGDQLLAEFLPQNTPNKPR